MNRKRLLPVVISFLLLSLVPGFLIVTAPASGAQVTKPGDALPASFCYEEPANPQADIGDLKARFNRSNWMQTLQAMYQRRWPSGEKLAIAQAQSTLWDGFVDKSSFEAFAASMNVTFHEQTHSWDLHSSRTEWDVHTAAWIRATQQITAIPLHGGFPRKEILPLIQDRLSATMDDTYLRDREQGSYRLQGVTTELNAGLMGLPAVTVLQEYLPNDVRTNARDVPATNLRYLLLYLRVAKDKHPDYWNKIKNEPKLRELVLIQFLRTAYWLEKSAPYTGKLGTPNADKITEKNYAPENIAILEEFTGRKVRLDSQKHCTA